MRRRAEPCRTFLVTTHMYARTRMRTHGIGSQENRFGRYGRFGRRPVHGVCWMGTASFAVTSPHVCAVLRSVPTFGQVRHCCVRPNTCQRGVSATLAGRVGTPKNFVCRLARGNSRHYRESLFCLSVFP